MNYNQAKRAVAAASQVAALKEGHVTMPTSESQVEARVLATVEAPSTRRQHVAAEPPNETCCRVCGGDASADELGPECPGVVSTAGFEARAVTAPGAALGAALDAALADAKKPVEPERPPEGGKPWAMHAMAAVKTMSLNPSFTIDDIWAKLDGMGIARPSDSRALGQVMQRLKREGVIKPTGKTVPTKQKSRHHAPIAVWVGTPGK